MNFIVKWALNQCLDLMGIMFTIVNAVSSDLFNESIVTVVLSAFKGIGFTVWALATVSLILKLTLSIIDGENIKIMDSLKRIVLGGFAWQYGITIMIGLYQLIFQIASDLIRVISGYSGLDMLPDVFGVELWGVILLIVALYHIIRTFFNLLERFWQYFVFLCMMYLYIPGYISGNDEALISWGKQTLAVCLTQLFQSLLLVLGMTYFISSTTTGNFCVAIGAIIAASNVEKYLDRWGLANSGGKIGNIVRNGMSLAFYTRSFLK